MITESMVDWSLWVAIIMLKLNLIIIITAFIWVVQYAAKLYILLCICTLSCQCNLYSNRFFISYMSMLSLSLVLMQSDEHCCNSCEEVREAYRKKGWAMTNMDLIDQVGFILFVLHNKHWNFLWIQMPHLWGRSCTHFIYFVAEAYLLWFIRA